METVKTMETLKTLETPLPGNTPLACLFETYIVQPESLRTASPCFQPNDASTSGALDKFFLGNILPPL
jgi:hypothetical protein